MLCKTSFSRKLPLMTPSFVKIVVFAPLSHADSIRETLANAGAGHLGNYDFCSFSSKGIGRFRGNANSNPTIGEPGKLEQVEEERIETIAPEEKLNAILKAVKKAHPYEEPAIDIYPLLNHKYL